VRRTYPDAVAYREAIQNPANLLPSLLLDSKVVLDTRQLPMAYTGRFAVVFRLRLVNGTDWAIRCHTNTPALSPDHCAARYRTLEPYLLDKTVSGLFAPVRYLPQGIRVAGEVYPILAMPWQEGEALGNFVERNRNNPATLLKLAETLGKALHRLQVLGIAHGDWQHDNILVRNNGQEIVFVDYDAMYCPELKGMPPAESGHPNYQNPGRRDTDFHADLDRFPCLLMQTALTALALEPSLWDSFNDGESLLFRRVDLEKPEESNLFASLRLVAERDTDLAELVQQLQTSCHTGQNPNAVSPTLFSTVAQRHEIRPIGSQEQVAVNITAKPQQTATPKQTVIRVKRGFKRRKFPVESVYFFAMRLLLMTCFIRALFSSTLESVYLSLMTFLIIFVLGFFFWLPNLKRIRTQTELTRLEDEQLVALEVLKKRRQRLRTMTRNPANLSLVSHVAEALQSVWLHTPETQARIQLTKEDRALLEGYRVNRLSDLTDTVLFLLPSETQERLTRLKRETIDIARARYAVVDQERRELQAEVDRLTVSSNNRIAEISRLRWEKEHLNSTTFTNFIRRLLFHL
jgi:serine/threonine protein kinase